MGTVRQSAVSAPGPAGDDPRERILADAGGDIPIYVRQNATDALGRPVFAEA